LQRCKPFFIDGKPLCTDNSLQSPVWQGLYIVPRFIFWSTCVHFVSKCVKDLNSMPQRLRVMMSISHRHGYTLMSQEFFDDIEINTALH
jgi:hypothetical protein